MKKVNGYIDLEEHFKEITKKDKIDQYYLEDKKIIKSSNTGTSAMFWFKYMDVNILFKAFNNEYSIYSELVSEELATELGLPNALYDMAKFQKYTGVITYDYKKIEYEYINLGRILTFYLENVLINENNENTYKHKLVDNSDINSLDLLNNLEDIWNALEFYLYNNKVFDKEIIPSIIPKLMSQLTDYFSFQLISGNYDMHYKNITLAIKKDGSNALLAPLFDNEDMFKLSEDLTYETYETPRLMLEREDLVYKNHKYDILEKYLKISSSEFVDRFFSMIESLNENTIYHLIARVEIKTGVEMPHGIKREISTSFNHNLKEIKKIVEQTKKKTLY